MNIIEELKNLNVGEVLENVDIRKYTTYRVGGKATALVYPDDEYNLIELIKFLKNKNIKYKIIGRGSNLIFVGELYDGVLIKLDKFDKLEIRENEIIVGSGYQLIKLATRLSRMGYTGIEFATGIPGSVGGAVYMNAGAYKSDMGYIVKCVKVLTPKLKIKELTNYDLNFHYRSSFIQEHTGYICLEVTLILKKGNPDEIMQLIEDRKKRLELWNKINEYGNGYISFKRLNYQLNKYLKLPRIVKNKMPIKLAFDAVSKKYSKYGIKKEDCLIEWMEFRIFLVYLRQFFEYWIMFEKEDDSGDHNITLDEFKKAFPQMKNWGIEISGIGAEKEFQYIDKNNSGIISFEEFCSYAINKSLNLEEDDGFDDEELKNLK